MSEEKKTILTEEAERDVVSKEAGKKAAAPKKTTKRSSKNSRKKEVENEPKEKDDDYTSNLSKEELDKMKNVLIYQLVKKAEEKKGSQKNTLSHSAWTRSIRKPWMTSSCR